MNKTIKSTIAIMLIGFSSLMSGCKEDSNEVLSAFGLINKKMDFTNSKTEEQIAVSLENARQLRPELSHQFEVLDKTSSRLDLFISQLKGALTKDISDPSDYETMGDLDAANSFFFEGDELSGIGQDFLDEMALYRSKISSEFKQIAPELVADTEIVFSTNDFQNRNGIKTGWMKFQFSDFPLIAVISQLTEIQTSIKTNELKFIAKLVLFDAKPE